MNRKIHSIDPRYSLAVNVADLRQRFVLFCGAGISKDAGIPIADDIRADMLRKVYEQDKKKKPSSEGEIEKWLAENEDIKSLDYSKCLGSLFPGLEQRRTYLNKFFEGKTPGKVHKLTAQLVKLGVFRFVITTNFDNLIEKALDEEGLRDRYSVISTDDQAMHSDTWDKVEVCRIYKIHGDKDQGIIRNIDKELSELGEHMQKDFQEIIDRHGVLVLGYSGSDVGVMKCFESREHLKYPIYWQYKNEPNDDVKKIIKNQDGKIIKADSAGDFLEDLRERIYLLQRQEGEGSREVLSRRVRQILVESNVHTKIIEIDDERRRFVDMVRTAYEKLASAARPEIWDTYVDLMRRFQVNLEFAENISKLNLVEVWDEYIKIFDEVYSIRNSNERYGRHGLINQLFYSLFLLVGSRALKEERWILIKKLLSIKRFAREYVEPILGWNVHGEFVSEKSRAENKNLIVPRLDLFLNILETNKLYPENETFNNAREFLLNYDFLCFIYSVRYPVAGFFPYWYPASMHYFSYETPMLMKRIKNDEDYRDKISVDLFNIKTSEFISFLKDTAALNFAELAKGQIFGALRSPFTIFDKANGDAT